MGSGVRNPDRVQQGHFLCSVTPGALDGKTQKLVMNRWLEASSLVCLVSGLERCDDQDCRARCLQEALACGLVSSQHSGF